MKTPLKIIALVALGLLAELSAFGQGAAAVYGTTNTDGSQTLVRSLRGPVLGLVDVTLYGADPTGTNDSSSAFTNAIAACPAYGTVIVGPGTYKLASEVTIGKSNITILGFGATITTATNGVYRKLMATAQSGLMIQGIRFNGGYTSGGTGLGTGCVELTTCTNCKILNCDFANSPSAGVNVLSACSEITVSNCDFNFCFVGIFSNGDGSNDPHKLILSHCHFRNGVGSTSTNFSGGIKISGASTNLHQQCGHVISDCTFDGCGQMGCELNQSGDGSVITNIAANNVGFGLSIAGVNNVSASNVTAKACAVNGVEIAANSQWVSLSNITIDGHATNGTADLTVIGLSIPASQQVEVSGGSIQFCQIGAYVQNASSFNNPDSVSLSGLHIVADENECVYFKDCTNFTLADSDLAVTGTAASYFVALDSTDANVQGGSIVNNRLNGTVASTGVLLLSPAHLIEDIDIHGNNSANAYSPNASLYNTNISGSGGVARISDYGNKGQGGDGIGGSTSDWATNLNIPVLSWNVGSITSFDAKLGTILQDVSSGAATDTLPDATLEPGGRVITIIKTDSGGNAITVNTTSSQTIAGLNSSGSYVSATSYSIASQGKMLSVIRKGAGWAILSAR